MDQVVQMSPISTRAAQAFVAKKVAYTLINGYVLDKIVSSAGHTIRVPAVDKVIGAVPSDPNRFHSAVDENGEYISGTIQVWDLYETTRAGVRVKVWDAKTAVYQIMGMSDHDPTFKSTVALSGLRVALQDLPSEDIRALKEESRLASENHCLRTMRDMLRLDKQFNKSASERDDYWAAMLEAKQEECKAIANSRGVSIDDALGLPGETKIVGGAPIDTTPIGDAMATAMLQIAQMMSKQQAEAPKSEPRVKRPYRKRSVNRDPVSSAND